ncbi:hypothetical protein D3C73_1302240 [compost metagenome]
MTWVSSTKTGNYDVATGQSEVVVEKESGIVDSIIVRDGVHYVKVGDKEVKISDIEQVGDPAEETGGAGQGADPS